MAHHHVHAEVVVWAVGYCHTRGTYAYADGMNLILDHWDRLPAFHQQTIRTLLTEAAAAGRPRALREPDPLTGRVTSLIATDTEGDHDDPDRLFNVDSSTLIWALRYVQQFANTGPVTFMRGLDLIEAHWDELSENDQYVISRDLFHPGGRVPETVQAKWDHVKSFAKKDRPYPV